MDSQLERLLSQAKTGAVFRADRDQVLRSLDVNEMKKFFKRWSQKLPDRWVTKHVPLAVMHKARLQILAFTPKEKLLSALWLAAHDFNLPDGMGIVLHQGEPPRYELKGAEYES